MHGKKKIQSQKSVWTSIAYLMVSLHDGIALGVLFPFDQWLRLTFIVYLLTVLGGGGSLGCEKLVFPTLTFRVISPGFPSQYLQMKSAL